MNTKSVTFIILMGLLTALTLAGSVIIYFLLFGPQGFVKPGLAIEPAGGFLFLGFPPIGGALWGWGIASLMKAEVKPLIKTGALTWTIWLFIVFFITGVIGPFGLSLIDLPNDHYEYLVVFLPAAGLAAALPARVMIGKLRLDNLKKEYRHYHWSCGCSGFPRCWFDPSAWFWLGGRQTCIRKSLHAHDPAMVLSGRGIGWRHGNGVGVGKIQ